MSIKLSKRTIAIISNFTNINSGILIEAGTKQIKCIKETRSVVAVADIEEDIPNNIAIYQVSEFLSCVKNFKDPMFDFQPKHCVIHEADGSNKLRYRYYDPSLIKSLPTKDIKFPDSIADTTITTAQLKDLSRTANTLGLNDVILASTDGELSITALNKDDKESNNYKVVIDREFNSDDFEAHFLIDNIKLIEGVYNVSIHPAITRWTLETDADVSELLNYYVVLEKTSKF